MSTTLVLSIDDVIIKGHQKVISHYRLLLKAGDISTYERQLIERRLEKEEEDLDKFIESIFKRKVAA